MFICTVQSLPTLSDEMLKYITTELYPQVYDGSEGYLDPIQRVALSAAELAFVCNTFYFNTAFLNKTYAYHFSIPPALHGDDVAYTFYNGQGVDDYYVKSVEVALAMQDWFVSFTKTGVPTSPDVKGVPDFPQYGADAKIMNIGVNGFSIEQDDADSERCEWWQKGLYF